MLDRKVCSKCRGMVKPKAYVGTLFPLSDWALKWCCPAASVRTVVIVSSGDPIPKNCAFKFEQSIANAMVTESHD